MFAWRTEGLAQAVVRAGEILLAFGPERTTLTAADVARITGLNRSTAHRILRSYEFAGIVRRGPNGFSLGPVVLRLADTFLSQLMDLPGLADPFLEQLRDATGETAALHIRDGMGRVVVKQVESRNELRRHYPDIGQLLPLHTGAPSRAILAFLAEPELDQYLALTPVAFPDAPPDPRALRADLARIRELGFAASRGQRTAGVASVAAPIFAGSGRVVAAINVSGPLERFDESATLRFADLVVAAAASLSEGLGHSTPSAARSEAGQQTVASAGRYR